MDRHFLVTISENRSALQGIRFLGNFFQDKTPVKATLFYSTPKPPALFENEASVEEKSRQRAKAAQLAALGDKALEAAMAEGVVQGFPRDNLCLKKKARVFTKAADIIREGEAGLYDAVVLGPRGLSLLEAAFEESLSRALFEDRLSFPLWLCRAVPPGARHILFYADGSEASFTMADHVGFMAGLEKRHRVDIIMPEKAAGDKDLAARYTETLRQNGLQSQHLQWLCPETGNIAQAILNLTRSAQYAAVALGRSGQEKSLLARLCRGPVCSVLFKELETSALWICH